MSHTTDQAASRATLKRLPAYHSFLKQLRRQGRDVVSCTHIAEYLNLDPTQVRKDLAATGITGRPRIGYDLPALMRAIATFLGWNNVQDAVVAGAGNLGRALLGFEGFEERGLQIVAAFDTDPAVVGTTLGGRDVFDLDRLPDLVERLGVRIGILTVPAAAAQEVANLMVLSGVRGLWNLTPAYLEVPPGIVVENVDLSASLAVLSNRLAEQLRREEEE